MARAVTRDGRTVILGPGESVAGACATVPPIADDPQTTADALDDERVLVTEWVRLLARWEPAIQAALDAGDTARADALWRGVERSAHAQVMLAALETGLAGAMPGAPTSERGRASVLRLVLGGRDERTIRRWRTGEQLVPEAALEFLARLRAVDVIASTEPEGPAQRLRVELVLD